MTFRSSKQILAADSFERALDLSASNMPSRVHVMEPRARSTGRPTRPRCPGSISAQGGCSLLATRNATLLNSLPPKARLLANGPDARGARRRRQSALSKGISLYQRSATGYLFLPADRLWATAARIRSFKVDASILSP